jgi:phosphoglycolate phosphatase
MRRLILFDIDGTLLSARGAPRRAFQRAMLEVYGTFGPIANHPFDGKTDPQIARELLLLAGVKDAAIDAGFPALWERYLRELRLELAKPDHETRVLPGVRRLLTALEACADAVLLGLLTGNIEPGAALKLESVGLNRSFRLGAFGSDCERRDGLPAIAVERARVATGRSFRGREIVVIGDTPSDVTCGRSLDVHAIGVATGRHGVDDLRTAGAHVVLQDLTELDVVLDIILDGSPAGD